MPSLRWEPSEIGPPPCRTWSRHEGQTAGGQAGRNDHLDEQRGGSTGLEVGHLGPG